MYTPTTICAFVKLLKVISHFSPFLLRAGKDSDVFVVPNLNVFYEEVELVYWDNEKCEPSKVPDPNVVGALIFPSTFVFNVKSAESKEALTFYSRHHIEKVKILELSDGVAAQEAVIKRVKNREDICCKPIITDDGNTQYKGSCLATRNKMVKCAKGDEDYEQERQATLKVSLNSWRKTLTDADQTKTDAINNNKAIQGWFNDAKVGQKGMADEKFNTGDMSIKDFKTQLASPMLIKNAKLLPEGKKLLGVNNEDDGREKIQKTKRIQFSGASGTYELSFDKELASEYSHEDCYQNIPIISGAATGGAVFGGGTAMAAAYGAGILYSTGASAAAGAAFGASVAASALLGPAVALAAGALVISSRIAGCNYELDVGLDMGDIGLKGLTFGVGAGSTLNGGKYLSLI